MLNLFQKLFLKPFLKLRWASKAMLLLLVTAVLPLSTYAQGSENSSDAKGVDAKHKGVAEQGFEIVAKLPADIPPGNIAVGPDGRIFLSVHEFYGQALKMVELLADGATRPYPNSAWAYTPDSHSNTGLYGVLGLNVDAQGILWMLDTSGQDRAGRLVAWNTKTEQLHRVIYLAQPIIQTGSFLNDLAIDLSNQAIYIADTGLGAIIVVDLETGMARRVLESASATKAEAIDMVIDGKVVELGGQPARLGINPITIDPRNEYVYFGAMTGTKLYRVSTQNLLNCSLSDAELAQRVEVFGNKPISDGITIDNAGHVYITAITDNAIGVVTPAGDYKTLVTDTSLSWPDGFATGADGYIYATINELQRSPVLNTGENRSQGLFKVIKLKPLAPVTVGR